MSFGFSATDFVLLVRLARRTFRNCQEAGEGYVEIAREVRCLRSVLKSLRNEAQNPESKIFTQAPASTKQLLATADGCKNVLDSLDSVLEKYEGLKPDGETSGGKRFWQRFRFGSKAEELGVIRGKLVTHASTMSILIDTMQIMASDRVEGQIDDGFTKMAGAFERIRKEIVNIASQKREEESKGATVSSLSLSTYAGDEKEVRKDFRRELVKRGFRSQSLDKHKLVLQAYMLDWTKAISSTNIKHRA
ncbi:hypothetical protein IFR04_000407 [Cadophora malorum]|uniref:Fungal N-terminal domain-containing protein n=1 Tax=Cadophora malorum TaxID=108018 RepID=A0A8H7WKF0_9HELO|nr:hypothetical protein IFR04_000407 [Cadophora malorum]